MVRWTNWLRGTDAGGTVCVFGKAADSACWKPTRREILDKNNRLFFSCANFYKPDKLSYY
ncbi:hypothetical protein Pelsub_P0671 [Pelolinea submarina]|nr:hypothetical protein Pelsub_P0671 [Pelolinea submarina]